VFGSAATATASNRPGRSIPDIRDPGPDHQWRNTSRAATTHSSGGTTSCTTGGGEFGGQRTAGAGQPVQVARWPAGGDIGVPGGLQQTPVGQPHRTRIGYSERA
jgi:hypothetical protein